MNVLRRTIPAGAVDPTADPALLQQVAALCTRQTDKGVKVLLVQASRGRWILPKGWPMDGRTDAEAAKLEAWEEAGVAKGDVTKAPIARYITQKRFDDGRVAPCLVTVYAIAVKAMTKDYPEVDLRKRRWVKPKRAIKLVSEDGLKDILRDL